MLIFSKYNFSIIPNISLKAVQNGVYALQKQKLFSDFGNKRMQNFRTDLITIQKQMPYVIES